MRVVFFGTPEFAVPSLAALLDAGVDVAAVVTQPDRPHARSHSTLVAPPVKEYALARSLAVWQPDRPRGDAFHDAMRALDADLGVVVAYGHVLRPELLSIPRWGFVNVHASLLPRWRGAAPIQWSMLADDADTGVSIMRVEAGLDTGAVWHRRHLPIQDDDTAGTLAPRLARLGAEALLETLPRIAEGAVPVPQDERAATLAPKIDRAVARVSWNDGARAVACRIRAMDPVPGAWTTLGAAEVKLFGATVLPADAAHGGTRAPGDVVMNTGQVAVAARDGLVGIAEVQPAGRRRMAAVEWHRGLAHDPVLRLA